MNTTEKIVELKNCITEAVAIIRQLDLDTHQGASPFLAGIKSKVTALEEHVANHQLWLAQTWPNSDTSGAANPESRAA